jgi:hypothetical protein
MTSLFRNTSILCISLLFAVTAPVDAAAPQTNQGTTNQTTPSLVARAIGRKLQEKGIPNFGEVTPTLYRGGLVNDTGLKALSKMGVKIVVDAQAPAPAKKRKRMNWGCNM